MRSVQLLIYRADEAVLEVRARDFKTQWMTAVEVLDDDTFLCSENSFNLFTLRKNSEAATDEDRTRLEVCLSVLPLCVPFSATHLAASLQAVLQLVLLLSWLDGARESFGAFSTHRAPVLVSSSAFNELLKLLQ